MKTCPKCGKEFNPARRDQRFCARVCAQAFYDSRKRGTKRVQAPTHDGVGLGPCSPECRQCENEREIIRKLSEQWRRKGDKWIDLKTRPQKWD